MYDLLFFLPVTLGHSTMLLKDVQKNLIRELHVLRYVDSLANIRMNGKMKRTSYTLNSSL
jgi:hypothetical protein